LHRNFLRTFKKKYKRSRIKNRISRRLLLKRTKGVLKRKFFLNKKRMFVDIFKKIFRMIFIVFRGRGKMITNYVLRAFYLKFKKFFTKRVITKKNFFRNYKKKEFKLFKSRNIKLKNKFIFLLKFIDDGEFLRYRRLFFVLRPKFTFKRAKTIVALRDMKFYKLWDLALKFKVKSLITTIHNLPVYLRRH